MKTTEVRYSLLQVQQQQQQHQSELTHRTQQKHNFPYFYSSTTTANAANSSSSYHLVVSCFKMSHYNYNYVWYVYHTYNSNYFSFHVFLSQICTQLPVQFIAFSLVYTWICNHCRNRCYIVLAKKMQVRIRFFFSHIILIFNSVDESCLYLCVSVYVIKWSWFSTASLINK